MVSYHRELEHVALAGTGLGRKSPAEGCEGIKPIDRTAKRCVAYITIYQLIIIARLRPSSRCVDAGLSAAHAFHCAGGCVKNGTWAHGELDRWNLIRVEWNHGISKTSLAIGDCRSGFSICSRLLAVTADCQTKNNHYGRKHERQAKRGSHVISLNSELQGVDTIRLLWSALQSKVSENH